MNLSLSIPTNSLTITPPEVAGTRRPLLTPIPNTPGEFLMVIDNSSLEKFTTCPKSSEFYLVHNREAHAKNAALVFGGAIHHALEAFELGLSDEEQDHRLVDFFTNHPVALGDYRTLSVALQVMKHYRVRATFPDYEWEGLADASGKQIVEKAFEIPIGVVEVENYITMPWLVGEETIGQATANGQIYVKNIHLAWSGRIDRLAHANSLDRACDHKTTSIGGDQVTSEYHLSNPMLGYTWASRKLFPEHDVRGACINFIHLRKPGVKGYPPSLLDAGPRGGEPPLNFFRAYYEYSLERLDWWEHNVVQICSDFIANLVRNYFPSHTKACVGKYGKCPYWDVCTIDNEQTRMNVLRSDMFKEVTWSPTADR